MSRLCIITTLNLTYIQSTSWEMLGWMKLSWTMKKAETWWIDAFELWFWRRLLRVPWAARLNQSILKGISLEYSWKWLMLKLNEAPVLWPPDAKSRLIRKDPDDRKDWRQGEKGTIEDEMFGWHHQLNGHEF